MFTCQAASEACRRAMSGSPRLHSGLVPGSGDGRVPGDNGDSRVPDGSGESRLADGNGDGCVPDGNGDGRVPDGIAPESDRQGRLEVSIDVLDIALAEHYFGEDRIEPRAKRSRMVCLLCPRDAEGDQRACDYHLQQMLFLNKYAGYSGQGDLVDWLMANLVPEAVRALLHDFLAQVSHSRLGGFVEFDASAWCESRVLRKVSGQCAVDDSLWTLASLPAAADVTEGAIVDLTDGDE